MGSISFKQNGGQPNANIIKLFSEFNAKIGISPNGDTDICENCAKKFYNIGPGISQLVFYDSNFQKRLAYCAPVLNVTKNCVI